MPLRSKGGEPGGEVVGEKPGAPGEAGQAIDPQDAVSSQEEHDEQDEDAMEQNPIGAVGGVASLLIHLALGEPHDCECQDRENKG